MITAVDKEMFAGHKATANASDRIYRAVLGPQCCLLKQSDEMSCIILFHELWAGPIKITPRSRIDYTTKVKETAGVIKARNHLTLRSSQG